MVNAVPSPLNLTTDPPRQTRLIEIAYQPSAERYSRRRTNFSGAEFSSYRNYSSFAFADQ